MELEKREIFRIKDIIGNLLAYMKRMKRAWDLYSYFYDMDIAISRIYKALKEGRSYMVFVIGNVKVPTDKILVEIAKKYGFKHEKTIYRRIPIKRIPWENAPEIIPCIKSKTVSSESIIIMIKYLGVDLL